MNLKIFYSFTLIILFDYCFNQAGIPKTKYVCIDDPNWLEKGDNLLSYELNCVYNGVSSINLVESYLHYAYKIDVNNWIATTFARFDCGEEILKWSAYKLNLTYSTQTECDKNTNRVAGFRQGAKCLISKTFLKSNMFKINRAILETRYDLYPIPYGLYIRYTCN